MPGLTAEEKALIAASAAHPALADGHQSAYDGGVLAAHPAPTAMPTANPESNAALRDELLGGAGKVTKSQGVE